MAGNKRRLHGSDDWIDIKTSTPLALWKHRPGGARFGIAPANYVLYRTEQGNLVACVPGKCLGIPYYYTACTVRFIQMTAEGAVDLLCATGAKKHAKRLFPELAAEWRPEAPPGAEV